MVSSVSQASKHRHIAISLAFVGVFTPGLHKIYLGQYGWGICYLLLSATPLPRIASGLEAVWYCFQSDSAFAERHPAAFPLASILTSLTSKSPSVEPVDVGQVSAIAQSLRELDGLRQDGLISEYEFEQKRRGLLDRLG